MTPVQPDPGDEDLSRLGYAQELLRAMGGFSSFAVSFSIISILTGITTTYKVAIGGGGPAALGVGWPLVAVGTLLVAMAMGELASAFPTAGALYHWSALLGGPGWGWLTATTNLVGQFAIVAAVDLGLARELVPTLGLPKESELLVYAAILSSHAWLNYASVRWVARLNDFSATVHVVGAVALSALLLVAAKHPPRFLMETGFTLRDDHRYGLGFVNALILGMFTFTGYDASAHLSEETHDPRRRAPWGIVSSVVVSGIFGYLYVVGLTLAIGDVERVARDDHAALTILQEALGRPAGRAGMGLALFAMWFCGLSSVTSASRTLYAFSRDRGLPFADALRRVHAVNRTPHVAILAATGVPLVLVLGMSRFSGATFDAMVSMATMGLYVSYALPIALGVVARRTGRWRDVGPWNLGRFGVPVAVLAVAWAVAVLVACSLPPNELPAYMLGGLAVALVAAWGLVVRHRFAGPKITLADLDARRE